MRHYCVLVCIIVSASSVYGSDMGAPTGRISLVKDYWDFVYIGTAALASLAIICAALLGVSVKRRMEKEGLLGTLADYIPLLLSENPREAGLAARIIELTLDDSLERGWPSFVNRMLYPERFTTEVRRLFDIMRPVIAYPKDPKMRICYGSAIAHLVFVYTDADKAWVPGILHSRWLVFPSRRQTGGIALLKEEELHHFSQNATVRLGALPFLALRLPREKDSLCAESASSEKLALVGFVEQNSSFEILVKEVPLQENDGFAIGVEAAEDEKLDGFLAVQALSKAVVGIVARRDEGTGFGVIPWQQILNAIQMIGSGTSISDDKSNY